MTNNKAIQHLRTIKTHSVQDGYTDEAREALDMAIEALEVKPISYEDCANAMLKMWMDNIVTDSQYYKIMDKLNAQEKERRANEGK